MVMTRDQLRGIVEAHQAMVFSIALRLTGDRGGAEEVAQDVFLDLFHARKQPGTDDHLRFWLRRVSVHRATDWLRRRARQPAMGADAWDEDEHRFAPRTASDTGMQARLEGLLRTLPEAMRVAIVMRYQEEMKPDEIAALLDQPLASVKSNLRRGLELLRRKAGTTLKEYVR